MRQVKLLVGVIALAAAVQAHAGCMDNISKLLHPGATPGATPAAHFTAAVYRPGALQEASLQPIADWGGGGDPIVGLWEFKWAGFSVDWGTQAWHADGTELTFSGGQNPETGDVCQGVWRKVGHNTYTMNHIAMGWLAPGAGFGIRVHLHFQVKLDPSGNSFSGTYTASVYQETPSDPFLESDANTLASGNGTVTAQRVFPD